MERFTPFFGGPLGLWFRVGFAIDGVVYNTAEQYMMAAKARLFNDPETLALIMECKHPRDQKYLGRAVKGFKADKWDAVSRDVVYRASHAKFTQNAGLREKLLATRGTTLVKTGFSDRIWGVGLNLDDPAALDRSKWRGLNWLGEVLTRVRDDIDRGVCTYKDFGWSER